MLRLNVNAVIENNIGEILFVRLRKGKFTGFISIPGGGIKEGETSNEAIIREIKEETGIIMDDINLIPIGYCELINNKKNDHRVVLLYRGKAEGTPKNSIETDSFWMKPEKIKEAMLPFAKKAIVNFKQEYINFQLIV